MGSRVLIHRGVFSLLPLASPVLGGEGVDEEEGAKRRIGM